VALEDQHLDLLAHPLGEQTVAVEIGAVEQNGELLDATSVYIKDSSLVPSLSIR